MYGMISLIQGFKITKKFCVSEKYRELQAVVLKGVIKIQKEILWGLCNAAMYFCYRSYRSMVL